MESVDANVLLRLTVGDISEQRDLARRLIGRPASPLAVSPVVLMEFLHALTSHYQATREQAADALRDLLDLDNLQVEQESVVAALDWWVGHPKLSFEDCYVAARAAATGATPLWTFDKKLGRQHPAARELTEAALPV
ncbi:MAG: PIN domain-containing protein [Propionibacteriaceae bacterium]|jgi:predicted nucleic acid-binding protein|nr:PIN domain-containing protein [Propionibacteriaceae bacterium]